ncbi:MAG: Sec-independent protein translocase protein TatB [Alphaproteobacteria bacterium]|nr:Sec-independent protein translocase protein TatB [Alphaproteobacteria bacterium]
MFDLGWPELMLIMVVALIVIGPKELPNAIRTVMSVIRKFRSTAREFQSGLNDIAKESGIDDVKRDFEGLDYYDPGAALKSIADSDNNMLGLEGDALASNSILNQANRPEDSITENPAPDEALSSVSEKAEAAADKPKLTDEPAS